MKRWIVLLLLAVSSSGCAVMDELGLGFDGDDYGPRQIASQSCNGPPPATVRLQTQEPELAPHQ